MAGRGVADRHLSRDHTEDALAVVCLDYTYLSDVEDAGPILVGKDYKHRWFYVMVMPTKGVGHPLVGWRAVHHGIENSGGGGTEP